MQETLTRPPHGDMHASHIETKVSSHMKHKVIGETNYHWF